MSSKLENSVLDRRDSTLRYGNVLAMERAADRDAKAAVATAMRLKLTLKPSRRDAAARVAKEIARAERAAFVWAELV